jgi:putative hydrolase of the HAD superfamily
VRHRGARRERPDHADVHDVCVPIRALLFDLGGVWLQAGHFSEREAWAAAHGMDGDQLLRAYLDAIGAGWEGGRSEEEIHDRLLETCGVDRSELSALLQALHAHEMLDPTLTEFIAAHRPTHKIGVITNAGPSARRALCERFALDTLADVIVVSAELGVSKPHPRIYEETTRLLEVEPSECAFVDDKAPNVDAARRLGMFGVQYQSSDQVCRELQELLANTG